MKLNICISIYIYIDVPSTLIYNFVAKQKKKDRSGQRTIANCQRAQDFMAGKLGSEEMPCHGIEKLYIKIIHDDGCQQPICCLTNPFA